MERLDFNEKCRYCGSRSVIETNHDYLDGHTLLEFSLRCSSCGSFVNHWAHGGFTEPHTFKDMVEEIGLY